MSAPATTASTCATLTDRLGTDTAGTASRIRSWLLLEHPGPWGPDTREEAFAAALGRTGYAHLRALWEGEWLRPLLIRRPGRAGRQALAEPRLLVGSIRPAPWLEEVPARALPSLDLDALAAGRPGHGEPVAGPLFAVCTNGTVDRCCAIRGRPLAAALAAAHPDRTWEVTHLGGCRFAANLLVLPDGLMYGSLTPAAGLRLAVAALDGHVDPERLRGRTGTTPYPATAEVELRRRLGPRPLEDVQVLVQHPHADLVDGEDGPEPAGADVLLRAGAGTWRAVVRTLDLGPVTSVCDGTEPLRTTVVTDLRPT